MKKNIAIGALSLAVLLLPAPATRLALAKTYRMNSLRLETERGGLFRLDERDPDRY